MGNKQNGIVIKRVFDAPMEYIFRAWTDPEMVKTWWGPKDFTAPSITIDLRVGGTYVFAMHGPPGSEWDKDMYSAGVYQEIIPPNPSNPSEPAKLVVTDYFSDQDGNKMKPAEFGQDPNFPDELTVTVLFEPVENNKTKLSIVYPKPETEERFVAMQKSGMEEGWNSSLDKLAAIVT